MWYVIIGEGVVIVAMAVYMFADYLSIEDFTVNTNVKFMGVGERLEELRKLIKQQKGA